MVFWWFSSSSLTVPKAATAIDITVALTLHKFCTCNLKFWYLKIFSNFFTLIFLSPETAMSMILHSLFSLSMTTISGLRRSISLSVWIAKSQSILNLSFSNTGSGWCENHLSSHSISNFLHKHQRTFIPSLPFLFLYWFPARAEHELTIWVALSTFSLQSLHSGDSFWWSMLFFITFVISACSWAAHIRLSVSRFSSPTFSHCHLLWLCTPSVSLRNWPCIAFSIYAARLSFSRSSLFFPSIFVLSCKSSVAAFRSLLLLFGA